MLDWLFQLPQASPIAHAIGLIALVSALGMALGSIKAKGIGLGSSGVLFMGILVAQFSQPLDPRVLNFVKEFGLVLFVFTLGLQLGPGFFATLRAEGMRLNVLAATLVLSAGVLSPLVGWLGSYDSASIGGLFAGATTNTPALGAAQQSLATLAERGIRFAGAGPDLAAAKRPAVLTRRGLTVGMVAFTDNEPGWAATRCSAGVLHVPVDRREISGCAVRLAGRRAEPVATEMARRCRALGTPSRWDAEAGCHVVPIERGVA